MALEDVDTPTLLVDLDAFERNLNRMAKAAAQAGVRLRPHAKTHKCAVIALRQLALGAVGVCCQKVSEAEGFIDGGVTDVLISNEVVGRQKLHRLAALAQRATVGVCVDDLSNVAGLNEAASECQVSVDVLIEVDVGGARCGVAPGEAALELTDAVHASSNLRFRGIQAYQGRAQHIRAYADRRSAIETSSAGVARTLAALHRHGLGCEIVSGGGTGTYAFEIGSGLYNEIQAGSYVFMDADYQRNLDERGVTGQEFEQSLFVYAQVMSVPDPEHAVVDAGLKAIAFDSGMPIVEDIPGARYTRPSDEHGVLDLSGASLRVGLETKLRLTPGHCDPTVNLHDWYVGVRADRVEEVLPIVARGALF